MNELSEFVDGLNSELESVENYDRNLVFKTFEKYVENKERLRAAIDLGLFQYDFAKYKTLFEATIFEDGISTILDLYRNALLCNKPECCRIFEESYPAIAAGFASRTQTMWMTGSNALPDRLDLFAKAAFQLIGDGIENSLKPYMEFLNAIQYIACSKPIKKDTLGIMVNSLISRNEVFKALYQTLFLDISVSQWRNIANHGSYRCNQNGKIEINYGEKNNVTQYLERTQLENILALLDTILYMHKTAYALIHIDHEGGLAPIQKFKGTEQDDRISQIVETSYAYGLVAFEIESKNWNIAAAIRSTEPSQTDLEKYCAAIAIVLNGSKFNVLIYNQTKVEFQIVFETGRAVIYKYVT